MKMETAIEVWQRVAEFELAAYGRAVSALHFAVVGDSSAPVDVGVVIDTTSIPLSPDGDLNLGALASIAEDAAADLHLRGDGCLVLT